MHCTNCGKQLNPNEKFCSNCGKLVKNQNEQNNFIGQNKSSKNNNNIIIIVVSIVGGLILLTFIISTIVHYFNYKPESKKNNYNYNENNNYKDNEIYDNNNIVKGKYSKDVFSGNSFDYITNYDTAVFEFNKDSTFKVEYKNGNTYTGSYEVYNGLFISTKTNEIENDTSIKNGEQMATDINNVTEKMMSNMEDIINTYLIWLEVDGDILQPFAIKYNPDTETGTAVNILGKTQGTFNLKEHLKVKE